MPSYLGLDNPETRKFFEFKRALQAKAWTHIFLGSFRIGPDACFGLSQIAQWQAQWQQDQQTSTLL